jgi:hypothetical protein
MTFETKFIDPKFGDDVSIYMDNKLASKFSFMLTFIVSKGEDGVTKFHWPLTPGSH